MNYLKQYKIPFSGLNIGEHHYDFTINNEFLRHFNMAEISDTNIHLKFCLDKQLTMLVLNFEFKGIAEVACDTCGDNFHLPLQHSQQLIVKLGDVPCEEIDNVLVIHCNDHEIDISQYVYEFFSLALPMKKVHPEGLCNPEIISKLSLLNNQEKQIDSRWEKLADLKMN
ncbi:MAG: hypothetical protein COA57_00775 [Flavobacteriales bacterium]|nr:MAG: hypothetical protein COA57_00775 [Flavobacteriales bacterium]